MPNVLRVNGHIHIAPHVEQVHCIKHTGFVTARNNVARRSSLRYIIYSCCGIANGFADENEEESFYG